MSKPRKITTYLTMLALTALAAAPLVAQTPVKAPKNPYKLEQDVELGRQAAAEVEGKLEIIRDPFIESYIVSVGRRLVEGIPREYDHPQFRYSFKVVNAGEINAFALPGGFMYVNRGLIEAARNEGELAGVMAHEISHVALRHGTAQVAKAQKPATLGAIGQILGAVIGGAGGAAVGAVSQIGAGAYLLKFSREYERQADTLGAQMMARAGYDPRDLANMFQTIEKAGGGRGGPEWLSSHPNPGNRYEAINREAELLDVDPNPIKDTPDFSRVRARLRDLPGPRAGGGTGAPPRGRVESPSPRFRTYRPGNLAQVSVPENWRELPDNDSVTYAPEGAYGSLQGQFVFTHGVQVGVSATRARDLRRATDEFIQQLRQGNPQLRQESNYTRGALDRREAINAVFSNYNEATRRDEVILLSTTLLDNGELFFVIAVAPDNEYGRYERTFYRVIDSIRLR